MDSLFILTSSINTNMGCPPQNCPADIDPPSWFQRFKKSLCFNIGDIGINITSAIRDVALAIREYTDAVQAKGYASALINFRMPTGGISATNGQISSYPFATVPFSYKVTGVGASILSINNSGGTYPQDDNLAIRILDATANIQYGPTLNLNANRFSDKFSNEGLPINPAYPIIPAGHRIIAMLTYTNTDGGSFILPNVDIFIHVEPVDLVTVVI